MKNMIRSNDQKEALIIRKSEKIMFHIIPAETFSHVDPELPEHSGVFAKKQKPIDSIGEIKDTPVLFSHGENDWIIRPEHSRKLYDEKEGKKKLVVVKNGLHAEKMFENDPENFKVWMLDWFKETL